MTIDSTAINFHEATIDREIAERHGELWDADQNVERAHDAVHRAARDRQQRRMGWGMTGEEARATVEQMLLNENLMAHQLGYLRLTLDTLDTAIQTQDEAHEAYRLAETNYTGWTRFFLVQNANGHIHSSLQCSTCTRTTRFAWLTDMSGLTASDAVEAHGERLCSVCFPDAPVAWHESYYGDEKKARKAARDAERAYKASEKAVKAKARALTHHYAVRFTRDDGEVFTHEDRPRTLASVTREVEESGGADGYNGRYEVVDTDTGEVV